MQNSKFICVILLTIKMQTIRFECKMGWCIVFFSFSFVLCSPNQSAYSTALFFFMWMFKRIRHKNHIIFSEEECWNEWLYLTLYIYPQKMSVMNPCFDVFNITALQRRNRLLSNTIGHVSILVPIHKWPM